MQANMKHDRTEQQRHRYANKPCYVWSNQAEVYQIFRRCCTIISHVNAYSWTMILQFIFQHLCNECKWQAYQSALITFSQYYLVGMATSLDKLDNKVHIHHLHVKRFHMVKRLRKLVQYIRIYSTKCANFLAVTYLTFTNKLCQLRSYWTEFHEICKRYRGDNYAANAHIEVAISRSVSECQIDKYRVSR